VLLREYKLCSALPEPEPENSCKRAARPEDGPAEKKKRNTGEKAASGSEEVVAPPPFPDMPEIRRVLNMPGPPLVQGTGEGKKLVENRATRMPLGDYVLRCANSKDWKKDLKVLEQQINQLPYEEGSLDHLRGKAVCMVRLAEHRTPEQCNGYPWAIGPVCHVITHVKWLKEPVDIPQKGQGPFIKLYAEKPKKPEQALCHRTIAEKVYEQVKDSDWIELDTSPLDAPALPNSGTSTSAGSSSSAGSGGASAADGTSPAGPETIDNTQPPTLPAAPPPKTGPLKRARLLAPHRRQTARRRAVPAAAPAPEGVGNQAAAIDPIFAIARHVPSVMNE